MNLLLKRDPSSRACTLGSLYVDDALFCFTLEDVVRADGVKVYGETAIPAGTYRVTLEKSKRFGRLMPYVHDVENFSGILFHWGSTAADTRGCVLVGLSRNADHLYLANRLRETVPAPRGRASNGRVHQPHRGRRGAFCRGQSDRTLTLEGMCHATVSQ